MPLVVGVLLAPFLAAPTPVEGGLDQSRSSIAAFGGILSGFANLRLICAPASEAKCSLETVLLTRHICEENASVALEPGPCSTVGAWLMAAAMARRMGMGVLIRERLIMGSVSKCC